MPAFAWLGAGAGLPPRFPILAALALLAGTALAVANGLVDLEGDSRPARPAWPASSAGVVRSVSSSACDTAVIALAVVTAWSPASHASPAWLAVALGAGLCAAGARLSASRADWRRRLGWELQAVAVGLVAVGWFALQGAT